MKPRILIALLGALATSGWAPAQADVVTDWNLITLVCVQGQPCLRRVPAESGGPDREPRRRARTRGRA